MHDPDLLILDEPTAGVAPNLIEDILDWEVEVKTKRGLGVLMVEQNVRRALDISEEGSSS